METRKRFGAPLRAAPAWVALAAAALVAGCFGGGGDDDNDDGPVTVSGVVADGPLSKALACYDLNDNLRCDAGEPTSAATDADGNFSIEVAADSAGQHAVVVDVPADAVDKDTGAAIGTALVMSAPASGVTGSHTVFVSPLTTLVGTVARQQGLSAADATAQVQQQLGMSASPLANFVTPGDAQAARLAASVNRLVLDITALGAQASLPAEQTQALIDATLTGHLPVLAAQAAAAGGTAQEAAAQASAAVLAAANLTPANTTAQAQAQAQFAAPLQAATPGAFVSVRRFTYTDANNFAYQLFVGDSRQVDAAGRFVAHDVRKTVQAGVEQPFNRNRAYWTGSAWQVCDRQWAVTVNTDQTASAPGKGLFCGASSSQSRAVSQDIAGQKMADVIASMRAYPLPDSDGLPTDWGPAPALLGDTVFPAGSSLSSRQLSNDIGGADSYGLLDKVSARGTDGFRRHLAGFDDADGIDANSLAGNLRDANVAVNGGNAAFLDQYTVAQPADATLLDAARWLIAFDFGVSNTVRFYKCDVVRASGAEVNCAAQGDGVLGAIESKADARLQRIASGYPAELLQATVRQRFFIEREGALLRGETALQRTTYNQRLNTTAWLALRDALGIAPHAEPVEPLTAGPFTTLRSFTFTDVDNYSWRAFSGDSSALDGQGYYLIDERREARSGGVLQAFVRNQLYWTGSEWFDCGNSGDAVSRQNSQAPFDSRFCRTYDDEGVSSSTATLDGRRMSDVVRDIRRFGSKDGSFDYRNWGPDQNVHVQLANAFFPAGSTLSHRASLRKATPYAIATSANDRVRVAPADTSQPFDTWPFATSMDEFIAKYPGDFFGASPSGSRTIGAWSYTLPTPPAPEYTTQVSIRVAFDANGRKARFYRAYRLASSGNSTAYLPLLDTTYSVETLGNGKVMRFAALPEGSEQQTPTERLFAEYDGSVWYGFKDRVTGQPGYSIRLNDTARAALFQTLGLQ